MRQLLKKAQRKLLRAGLIHNLNIFQLFKRARRDSSDATPSDLSTDFQIDLPSTPGQDDPLEILSQSDKSRGDETGGRWRFDSAQQGTRRRLPRRLQASMLGLALVALWWSWPLWANTDRPFVAAPTVGLSGEVESNTPESAAARASLQTLAIINPENLPRPEQATLHSSEATLSEDATAESGSSAAGSAELESESETGEQEPGSVVTIISSDEAPVPVDNAEDMISGDAGHSSDDVNNDADILAGMDEDASQADIAVDAHDESAETRLENRVIVAVGASPEDNPAPDDDFPEVGQVDPDALSPFTVDVDIPDAAESNAMSTLPAVASQPVAVSNNGVQADLILLPTATPMADAARLEAQAANLPRVEIIPAIGAPITPTPEPSPTLTPTPTPTPIPSAAGRGRLWSTFMPQPAPENDHYWIGNPFAGISANHSASPSYQFGSTAGNRYRPHHGLDISNPPGTPVRAGVVGQVVHAGPDDPELLGPYNNFYGNTVVILLDQRLPVAGGELDVYLLYGHLSEVRTEVAERVGPDDIVGLVGMTGIAIGPHLHVEVRLGANTYDHSVNPYLWLEPPSGSGTVAVRILTADGHTWAGSKVSIARFEGGAAVWARQIETYLDTENIGPDPAWGENGAMGDVPAGHYHLIGNVNGENIRAEFTVNAGETTFIEVRTQE